MLLHLGGCRSRQRTANSKPRAQSNVAMAMQSVAEMMMRALETRDLQGFLHYPAHEIFRCVSMRLHAKLNVT